MIYETDIIKGITKRIEKYCPPVKIDNKDVAVKVENQDLKNCLNVRPCFFVRSIQTVDNQVAAQYELNSFSFEVIYFAKDNNKGYLELLQAKRFLKAIFNKPLKIIKTWVDSDENNHSQTYFVELDSLTCSINEDDYVLNCIVETKIEQKIDYSDIALQFAVDLDSENITDDADFNREMLDEMDASVAVDASGVDTFDSN